jgi:dGTPase
VTTLAPYATQAAHSRGRRITEAPSTTRSAFQRDRDRIIHCGAFRRLRNKTQVFVEFEGDFYRTRLTHSLEVAQIARSISRQLGLDEDLTEAIALAHDLGHTCFGHCGEDALNRAMQPYGGFSHNDQTVRILTQLETRYPEFDGLNLSWETLEGIVKHNGPLSAATTPPSIAALHAEWDLELGQHCGLEGQVAALADDIAYNTHDVDDGMRAGLLSMAQISALPIFGDLLAAAQSRYPTASPTRLVQETVRQVIGHMVDDVLTTTRTTLARLQPENAAAVRAAGEPIVCGSVALQAQLKSFRTFLMQNMYRQPQVNRFNAKGEKIVTALFEYYMMYPHCLPADWYQPIATYNGTEAQNFQARRIADYIAGMTDRYAVLTYQQAFSMERFIC